MRDLISILINCALSVRAQISTRLIESETCSQPKLTYAFSECAEQSARSHSHLTCQFRACRIEYVCCSQSCLTCEFSERAE